MTFMNLRPLKSLSGGVVRDVLYACRSFRRAPLVAVTIVMTVGVGLGLVAVVFTLLNSLLFQVDEVRNPHELFAVERQRSANAEPERFTREQSDALVHEAGLFSDAFAKGPDIDVRIDGRRLEGSLVTGNFFHVLGVGAARGRTLAPSDELGDPAIVLSHRAWSRHFASDPAVFGRPLLVNGVSVQVVGVMPEGFRGLVVAAPDFWAPLSLLGQIRRNDPAHTDAVVISIIGRLNPGLSDEQALARLRVWDGRQPAPSPAGRRGTAAIGRPAQPLVLEQRQGTVALSADVMALFTPLFFAFGLILMIACANVANLLLARAVTRQREIGVRLAIGASRRRLIGQLLTESLVLALVSAALAFGISRIVLAAIVYAVTTTWAPAVGDIRLAVPPADWRVALFLVAGAIGSTVFFALAPALQATRLELVRAMRGEVVRDGRPGRARNVLVAVQVTASVLLLICAAVFLRSALGTATIDPGIRTADTVFVNVTNEQMRGALLEAVKNEPSVASVAASWPGPMNDRAAVARGTSTSAEATVDKRGRPAVGYKFVSPEYFNILGIDIVRGRGFAQTERSASAAVTIVSEGAARALWPDRDAVGQVLQLEPDTNREPLRPGEPPLLSRTFVVVGIARDVVGFQLGKVKEPTVYVPIDAEAAQTSFAIRVHGDPERTRLALLDRFAAIDPGIGEVATARSIAAMVAYLLQIAFWLTVTLGTLALVLTLSGLFSVLSYLVEQRTREIGVRIALGATGRSIATLVLAQMAGPVGIGLILGGSLTGALGAVLLATLGSGSIGSIVRLFDPVAYAASLLCIVTASVCAALIPALRAGRIDPIAALRQD
jgi:predicted permease